VMKYHGNRDLSPAPLTWLGNLRISYHWESSSDITVMQIILRNHFFLLAKIKIIPVHFQFIH
ncbi:MAG: hypothetical protein ACTSPR_03715, partial [Candidatus Thorarchaeota archaeon]